MIKYFRAVDTLQKLLLPYEARKLIQMQRESRVIDRNSSDDDSDQSMDLDEEFIFLKKIAEKNEGQNSSQTNAPPLSEYDTYIRRLEKGVYARGAFVNKKNKVWGILRDCVIVSGNMAIPKASLRNQTLS